MIDKDGIEYLESQYGSGFYYWSFVGTLARAFGIPTDGAPYDESVLCNLVLKEVIDVCRKAVGEEE